MSSQEQSKPKTAVEFFNAGATTYEEGTGGCTRELALKILDLPQLVGVFSPDAEVLDNACGTGIIAEEIARRCSDKGIEIPRITSVDAAENMVEVARAKFAGTAHAERLRFAQLPAERLELPDGAFSHSITNLGILFFGDGEEGAREIWRTLRSGGVAVVTSWSDLGYLDAVIRPAQKAVKPEVTPLNFPLAERWINAEGVKEGLKKVGFSSVDVFEEGAHYGSADVEELVRLLGEKFPGATEGWAEEDKEKFRAEVDKLARKAGVPYKMGGKDMVGIPMMGIIAVCTK